MINDEASLEYYRQNPQKATRRYGLTREQALAAISSDPSVYSYLNDGLRSRDSQHNYELLRATVAADPKNLWRAFQPKNIPVDVLLAGLQSAYIWNKIVSEKWVAYDNNAFLKKYPQEAELIALYRQLNIEGEDCLKAYHSWQRAKNTTDHAEPLLDLPYFD